GLGLTDEEFTHLTRNDWQKIDLKKISNIAYVMGAKSANDVNAWRQFVTGSDQSITQEALDNCFSTRSPHKIDFNAKDGEHRDELAKFLKLLGTAHGLPTLPLLLNAVAKANGSFRKALKRNIEEMGINEDFTVKHSGSETTYPKTLPVD